VDAINSGAKLPLTAKEIEAKDQEDQKGQIAKYVQQSSFNPKTFNQILVLWIVRFSLPWNRIEDFLLSVAFNYARRGIRLYS
jgi:hypothetical protein